MAQPTHTPVRLSPDLTILYKAEAQALIGGGGNARDIRKFGVPTVLNADINRYRSMAGAAVPHLTERQWGLLSHVLDGAEFARLIMRDDSLPGPSEIAAGIMDWMRAGGSETSPAWARQLYDQVLGWSPLTIAGVLFRLRSEEARKVEAADDR